MVSWHRSRTIGVYLSQISGAVYWPLVQSECGAGEERTAHCYFRNNKNLALLNCSGICGMSCAVLVGHCGNEHCGVLAERALYQRTIYRLTGSLLEGELPVQRTVIP